MNFQSANNGFDLLEYLSFSLSEYLQKKLSFLELQLISSNKFINIIIIFKIFYFFLAIVLSNYWTFLYLSLNLSINY